MPFLELEAIHKRYPGAKEEAVSAVSLAVEEGESVALVGESGSGKTTLLRIVAGLERPDRGVIRIGREIWSDPTTFRPPEERRIGMLFQDHALFPHLTVEGNLAFGLHRLPSAQRLKVIHEVLEKVQLGGFGDRYPHQLSGGQRQRIALARALAPSPRILLLDEPFSHLDAMVKAEIRDEIYELLAALKMTTISVSHDLQDALRSSQRIALLQKGRMIQEGTPKEIYRQPKTAYAARFFGAANLLPAFLVGQRLSFPPNVGAIQVVIPASCSLPTEAAQTEPPPPAEPTSRLSTEASDATRPSLEPAEPSSRLPTKAAQTEPPPPAEPTSRLSTEAAEGWLFWRPTEGSLHPLPSGDGLSPEGSEALSLPFRVEGCHFVGAFVEIRLRLGPDGQGPKILAHTTEEQSLQRGQAGFLRLPWASLRWLPLG